MYMLELALRELSALVRRLAWILSFLTPFVSFSACDLVVFQFLSMLDLKVGCCWTYSRINELFETEYLVSFVNVKENKSVQ